MLPLYNQNRFLSKKLKNRSKIHKINEEYEEKEFKLDNAVVLERPLYQTFVVGMTVVHFAHFALKNMKKE